MSRSLGPSACRSNSSPPIRRTEITGFIVVLLVLLTLLAGAVAVGSIIFPDLERGWRSRSWPVTQGVLAQKELVHGRGRNLVVRYDYAVDGTEHSGSRVSYVGAASRSAVGQLLVGRPVAVSFDPERPGESVLFPGVVSWRSFMALLLVAFPLVAVCGWLTMGVRRLLRP